MKSSGKILILSLALLLSSVGLGSAFGFSTYTANTTPTPINFISAQMNLVGGPGATASTVVQLGVFNVQGGQTININ